MRQYVQVYTGVLMPMWMSFFLATYAIVFSPCRFQTVEQLIETIGLLGLN